MEVSWPETNGTFFIAGIKVLGEDTPGMLNEISQTIVNTYNTNIKGITIRTHHSIFYGSISVQVKDLEHLTRIIERLKKIKGIDIVERFEETN
jgi:(p)ppGpp synthase/HD superfamily hydrolase